MLGWRKDPREQGERAASRPWYKRPELAIALLVTVAGLTAFRYASVLHHRAAAFLFLQNVELRSLDSRFVLRGTRPHDERIVIVGIDEKTLQRVGSFPIARSAYAGLLDRLKAAEAKVVAFDLTFPTPEKNSAVEVLRKLEAEVQARAPGPVLQRIQEVRRSSDNDALLAEAMRRADNVVLGHIFLDAERAKSQDAAAAEAYYNVLWGKPLPQMLKLAGDFDPHQAWLVAGGRVDFGIEPNIPVLAEAARSYGFFNAVPDSDGTIRRALLLTRYRELDWFPPLAFQTVREYEGVADNDIAGFMAPNGLERLQLGRRMLRTERDGTALINYAGPFHTYRHYSMSDVMEGAVPAGAFRDKIVLVGPTALGIGDLRVTPYQATEFMGVEIHANIIDNILHNGEPGRGFLTRGGREEMIDLAFLLLFGLVLGWIFVHWRPMVSTLVAVAVLGLFGVVVFVAFARFGMWLSFVLPAGVLVANYAAVTSFRMIFEEREKRKIRRAFGQYVAPGVIALLEKDPQRYFKPGGEMREMTVLFSDIRSFTSIAEGMTPDALVRLLNQYLGEMTDVLFKSWGTLDKYIGDAIMAFWNSPFPQEEHAMRGASCALNMMKRLGELNRGWAAAGGKQLHIGIGLNTGPVNVGNMGSDRRLSWTVMGDHVNLASRLEGMTKEYRCPILISEFTYAQIQGAFVCRELDRIRVKGKQQPVAIYELVSFLPDFEKHADRLSRYGNALAAYRRQDWNEAPRLFLELLSKYPDDGPARVMLQRCEEFRAAAPPRDWDGVYIMTYKK